MRMICITEVGFTVNTTSTRMRCSHWTLIRTMYTLHVHVGKYHTNVPTCIYTYVCHRWKIHSLLPLAHMHSKGTVVGLSVCLSLLITRL